MLKYEFDEVKKEKFLQFWKIEKLENFEQVAQDITHFAFCFSKLYAKHDRCESLFAEILRAGQKKDYLRFEKGKLLRGSEPLLVAPVDKKDEAVVELDDVNILSWVKDSKYLSAGTDFLQLSPLFLHYLKEAVFLPKNDFSALRKTLETQKENSIFPQTITGNSADMAMWMSQGWNDLAPATISFFKKLYLHQGLLFSALDEKTEALAVRSLLALRLAILARCGDGCAPAIVFNAATVFHKPLKEWIAKAVFSKGQSKSFFVESIDENTLEESEKADRLFYEPQRLTKRFIQNFLFSQASAVRKKALTPLVENERKNISEARAAFLKKQVVSRLEDKKLPIEFLTMPFEFRCRVFLLSVLGKYTKIFCDFTFLATLQPRWQIQEGQEHREADTDSHRNSPLHHATIEQLAVLLNRLRTFIGQQTFSLKVYKRFFSLLSRLSIVSFVGGRLCYSEEMLKTFYSVLMKKISRENFSYQKQQQQCIVDSDMTITAYRDSLSLENMAFIALFCKIVVSEYTIRFIPSTSSATLAWYCGVGKEEVLDKLKELGSDTYDKNVEDYFSVYFEHARGLVPSLLPNMRFSSKHFFQSVKYALIDEKTLKSKIAFVEEKMLIFFFSKQAYTLAKKLLLEKKLIREN